MTIGPERHRSRKCRAVERSLNAAATPTDVGWNDDDDDYYYYYWTRFFSVRFTSPVPHQCHPQQQEEKMRCCTLMLRHISSSNKGTRQSQSECAVDCRASRFVICQWCVPQLLADVSNGQTDGSAPPAFNLPTQLLECRPILTQT